MNIHSTLQLEQRLRQLIDATPITDIHTHLFSSDFGDQLLWGIDDLLTYHYLIAETMRYVDIPYESFFAMAKQEQADLIWKTLFIDRSPISEACRGVLTVLSELGIDLSTRDLNGIRRQLAEYSVTEYIDLILKKAGVSTVVMTNDPLDDDERAVWLSRGNRDDRFRSALRLDGILLGWRTNWAKVASHGYAVTEALTESCLAEVRRFLLDWIDRMSPLYVAVSLPDTFQFPDETDVTALIEQALLPVARSSNLPFALMIGVRRSVQPALRSAGDGMGKADLSAVEALCRTYPDNKFMVTMLSRDNQHELAVVARKFRNLLPFGCWWFLNNPSLIREITLMRTELLGLSYIPQHSDSRILDQLLYKWKHSKVIITNVLLEKYSDLMHTGWVLSDDDLARDVADLFGGAFWAFTERRLSGNN